MYVPYQNIVLLSGHHSPHLKSLVVKTESFQRFFTKRLQGMWNKGYSGRLRQSRISSYIYSDLVLCFQLLSNGFNSQLVNTLIKSTDNRTRGHNLKLIKQSCSADATKYYFTNRVVNRPIWNSLPLALQHSQHSNHDCKNTILHLIWLRLLCRVQFYILYQLSFLLFCCIISKLLYIDCSDSDHLVLLL